MNRYRARKILPIIQAFADGKDIQIRDGDGWLNIGSGGIVAECLDNYGLEYRIKPKPREWWLAPESVSGDGYGNFMKLEAEPLSRKGWVKVREVEDES